MRLVSKTFHTPNGWTIECSLDSGVIRVHRGDPDDVDWEFENAEEISAFIGALRQAIEEVKG